MLGALEELTESKYPKKSSQLRLFSRDKSFEIILMLVLLKNAMVKILTQEIQSIKINILDPLEAALATIATLQ